MPHAPARSTNGIATAFALGVICVTFCAHVPDVRWALLPVATLSVVAIAASFVRQAIVLTIVFLLGFGWGADAARNALAHRADSCVDGLEAIVRGRVEGLPIVRVDSMRFDVVLDAPHAIGGCTQMPMRRLRVTWYSHERIAVGERWLLRVRLRSVRGFQNPATFDYEAQLLARAVDAAGTVRAGRRLAAANWSFDSMRERIAASTRTWPLEHRGILLALTTGDSREIRSDDWDMFQRTGTVHLVVISGMHISLAAVLGLMLGQWIAKLLAPLARRTSARRIGFVGAVLSAAVYAGLAGGGTPVTRAWLTAGIAAVAVASFRPMPIRTLFSTVLAIVLLVDPLASLSPGFWLSFGAVAVLLAGFAPWASRNTLVRDFVRAQALLFVAMLPLSIVVLHQVSWVAPIANLFAVPFTSLGLVPLLALGLCFDAMIGFGGETLWTWADRATDLLLWMLHRVAQLSPSSFEHVPWSARLVGTIAAACWLLPLAPKHRCFVALGMLPLFVRPPTIPDATFRIAVLDVGQGQSVIVDTARHRLLYDAGPRYLSGFDLGSAVVVPAFRATGRSRLDMLVLSHGDLDHVGGAAAVAMRLRPRAMLTGSLTQGFEHALRCRAGTSWQWDGVRLRILHPDGTEAASRNDESCVLEVSARGERALIVGDIGASVERTLVTRGRVRPATLLVVPHHGSKSSSTVGWVRATRPLWAIVSVGHANRFGHPAPQTVGRYAAAGACVRTTADAGAMVWSSARPRGLTEWRRRAPPYWRVGASRAGAARCM